MLSEDPVTIIRKVLIRDWNSANVDIVNGYTFDPAANGEGGVNTGQDREIRTEPQITIIHINDSTTGNTGYNMIGAGGPAAWYLVMLQVDVWVPDTDYFNSTAQAKRLRWQLQQETKRIVHKNARGTTNPDGSRQLQNMGVVSLRRSAQSDPVPTIYRSSIDLRCSFHQLPPQS